MDFVIIVCGVLVMFATMMFARYLANFDMRAVKKRQARIKLLSILENLPIEEVRKIAQKIGVIKIWDNRSTLLDDEKPEREQYRLPEWVKIRATEQELGLFGALLGSLIHNDLGMDEHLENDLFKIGGMIDDMVASLKIDQRQYVLDGCRGKHTDALGFLERELGKRLKIKRENLTFLEHERTIQAGIKACK